jgi:hypothetical protein
MKKTLKTLALLPLVTSMAAVSADNDTSFTYGGFIKLDALMTSYSDGALGAGSIGRDFYIPSLTPIGGADEDVQFDFHARQSRFFFGTETKLASGKSIKTKIEFDFMATPDGNERISNSWEPRMRHAFLTYDKWLFGQTWTTFQDVGALPESVDFIGATDGTTFARQAMIRYTDGPFSIAIENPESTITPFGGGGRIVADDNSMPDLAANYKFALDGGSYVKVSALARQLSYSDQSTGGSIDDSASSFGVSLSGRFNFGDDNIKFMLTTGSGLGRYVALNAANGAVLDAAGNLDSIDSTSGFIAWHHNMGDGWRTNLVYSMFEADNPVALTGTGVTESSNTIRANLMYSPEPKLSYGIEISRSNRENAGGADGDMTRLQFAAKYAF